MDRAPRILLSGGGSGGHIYPALAIADAIHALRPEAELLFVGALGKMEMKRIPAAGYRIEGLPVAGFHRKLDRRNLSFPFKLVQSLWKARAVVQSFKPDVAVGTGGYASGPALAAARLAGVPVYVQEQNAFPGVTNRLIGRFAEGVFLAYPEADVYFASAKTYHTGNPLRTSIDPQKLPSRAEAFRYFKLDPNKPTVLSFGGSQGARSMNEAHAAMEEFWRKHEDLQLIWQTGEGYFSRYRTTATAQLNNVNCLPYLERMDLAYAAADVVACRAGALSISELQLLGKASLLIPSPNVAGDHQTANAKAVVAAGGGQLIPDGEQVSVLTTLLPDLLQDAETLRSLGEAARMLAKPDAARTIAQQLLTHVD